MLVKFWVLTKSLISFWSRRPREMSYVAPGSRSSQFHLLLCTLLCMSISRSATSESLLSLTPLLTAHVHSHIGHSLNELWKPILTLLTTHFKPFLCANFWLPFSSFSWAPSRRQSSTTADVASCQAPGMLASVHIHETTQVDLPDVLLCLCHCLA